MDDPGVFLKDLRDSLACAFLRKMTVSSTNGQFIVRPQNAELLFMSYAGTVDEVRTALSKGADVGFQTRKGCTALMLAAFHNTADVVRCLIEEGHADLETRVKGGTALCFAALSEREDDSVIRVLIEAGADINVIVMQHLTPLMIASYSPRTPEKALALIEAGADINEIHDGKDALIRAIEHGRFNNARALLAAGASTKMLLKTLKMIRAKKNVFQNDCKGNEVITVLEAHEHFKTLTEEYLGVLQAILCY